MFGIETSNSQNFYWNMIIRGLIIKRTVYVIALFSLCSKLMRQLCHLSTLNIRLGYRSIKEVPVLIWHLRLWRCYREWWCLRSVFFLVTHTRQYLTLFLNSPSIHHEIIHQRHRFTLNRFSVFYYPTTYHTLKLQDGVPAVFTSDYGVFFWGG